VLHAFELQVRRTPKSATRGGARGDEKRKKKNDVPTYLLFFAKNLKKHVRFFYRIFEFPSPRNAQKRDKKNVEKKSALDFWSNFL
jgi:hypothetical protein